MPLLTDRTTPDGLRVIHASGELDRTELKGVMRVMHIAETIEQAIAQVPPPALVT
jgi:hypothetical protein